VREALATLDKAEQTAQRLGHRLAREQAQVFRALLELAQGHLAQAEQWSEEAGLDVSDALLYEHETAYLLFARLRLAQHRAEEAVGLLEHLLEADEAAGRTGNVISVLALQAVAHLRLGNTDQGMQILDRLLTLAEPEGYVRVFVDEGPPMHELLTAWLGRPARRRQVSNDHVVAYAQKLLAAFPHARAQLPASEEETGYRGTAPVSSPLLEPLSMREQDVLELVAMGLSNAEIAERLVVTVGTVKTHMKSIYGKLGVHSRTQAVARAREVGLL
jgi:LuxR family maltose regulon positive regulatory protein